MYKEQYLILVKLVDMKCGVRFVQVNNVSTPRSLEESEEFDFII